MNNQIAQYLKINSVLIVEIREFAFVYLVIFRKGYGLRPRFVSKRAVNTPVTLQSVSWVLESSTRRQEAHRKWVARIDGVCDQYDGLKRTFLSSKTQEWGKCGVRTAVYEIGEVGFYQDSDGDYFKAWILGNKIVTDFCSKLEVKAHFGLVKV